MVIPEVTEVTEEALIDATVGDVTPVDQSPEQKCPGCGILSEGHMELKKGRPRKQEWGGKMVKLAPVMMVCTVCGHGYELVGLEKGKLAKRPASNLASVKKSRRKMAKASRKANAGHHRGNGKGK